MRRICSLLICILCFLGLLMAHGYTAWTVSGSALEAAGHCGPATQAAGPALSAPPTSRNRRGRLQTRFPGGAPPSSCGGNKDYTYVTGFKYRRRNSCVWAFANMDPCGNPEHPRWDPSTPWEPLPPRSQYVCHQQGGQCSPEPCPVHSDSCSASPHLRPRPSGPRAALHRLEPECGPAVV